MIGVKWRKWTACKIPRASDDSLRELCEKQKGEPRDVESFSLSGVTFPGRLPEISP